jgi:hypothetical protein
MEKLKLFFLTKKRLHLYPGQPIFLMLLFCGWRMFARKKVVREGDLFI